jgi:hypothetical protein
MSKPREATPMLSQERPANGVMPLLEALYLDAANSQAKIDYARLPHTEKRAVLIEFAELKAKRSKRWAGIVRDLKSADIAGNI